MFVPSKQFLLGSALLLAAFPVLAADESGSIAPSASPLPRASINCPGVTSVPMTADAEQGLPLQLTGSLSCGENVIVLSDNEGYTTRIRTAAGAEGYVAHMYLSLESSAPLAPEPIATSAVATNGVVRWAAGAPGCEQFSTAGRQVESVTANGVTVQVSLQDTGWKFRANIAISNHGESKLDVIPSLVSLDELKPGMKSLPLQSPRKLQHSPNHQVLWTASNAQASPSAVAQRSVSGPAMSTVAYRTPSAATDYFGPSAISDSRGKHPSAGTDASDIAALSLKAVSLPAGEHTRGVVWFERAVDARELSLRVVAGDMVFDFPLSFAQMK